MKKNKAFTLVELLAIIIILGVMVILVVPQIGGSINSKKEKELEKIIGIVENAGKAYHSFNNDVLKIPIDTLVSGKYLTNDLTNPVTNEKLDGCVRVYKDSNDMYNYKYTTCEIQVSVTIDLKGGSSSQFSQEITQNTYADYTEIELVDPTKQNSEFKKWQVVKGNSNINGKTLIVGDTETIVYAIWESWPTLTLNLNEGSLDQTLSSQYASGTNITLKTPTREGYTFAGWSVNKGEGNSIVSGNNFTMGSIDTILTANWTINTYKITYELGGGTNASENPKSGTYGTTVTINNPTRTGYTFAGWTVTGAGSSLDINTNKLTIGTENVTLTAKWTANTYTITYNLNGGTNASGNPTRGTYGTTITISNPTKAGYKFAGWNVTGASMSGTRLTIGSSNIILTANWRLETLVEKIESLYATTPTTEGLIMDEFGNIRYAGSSPKNYIKFNGEDWRIIGIFTVKTASGNNEKLVKIVKDSSIEGYSWDSSSSGVNSGYGINEWSQADLMTELNTLYLNQKSGNCYNGANNASTACNFSTTGINSTSRNMIEEVVWNTGAITYGSSISRSTAYSQERGTSTGKALCKSVTTECNDNVARKTTWKGKVGLIYPSDYGYASKGGTDIRSASTGNQNWLYTGLTYWTLSPAILADSGDVGLRIFYGFMNRAVLSNGSAVKPAVYLKSNVSTTSGVGSSSSAYQISMS